MKTASKISVKEMKEGLEARVAELKKELVGLSSRDIKKSTESTRRHNLRRELRITILLLETVKAVSSEEMMVSEEALQGFNQLCYPAVAGSKVEVKEGDDILSLMEKYADTADLLKKLNKAADKIGCKLDFTTGKVVKK